MENKFLRCEDEPIHIPNFIQPLGYFVVVDITTNYISHISQNIQEDFSNMALGEDIIDYIPDFYQIVDQFQKEENSRQYLYNKHIHNNDEIHEFDFIISMNENNQFFIEFLPINTQNSCIGLCMAQLTEQLLKAETKENIFTLVSQYIKDQIGYDRVMIYKFDKDYNGQVIHEEKIDSLSSYLHLHYPASDIPTQARDLYLKNHIRIISDSSYTPVNIITNDTKNIDMTYSFLRSVSPIHLEYMQNMGVTASLTISLIVDGKLWGLIAAHNSSPLTLGVKTINKCEYIGKVVSSLIKSHLDNIKKSKIVTFEGKVNTLLEIFKKDQFFDMEEIISKNIKSIRTLFDADGIILSHDNYVIKDNIDLKSDAIHQINQKILHFLSNDNKDILLTDSIIKYFPDLKKTILKECSGVFAFRLLENENFFLILTRTEKKRDLSWGGNPDEKIKKASKKYLSPRESFERFIQTVEYRATDWDSTIQEKLKIFKQKIDHFNGNLETQFHLYQKSAQLEAAQIERDRHNEQLIDLLLRIIELRDAYTAGHTIRVAQICDLLAIELGIEDQHRVNLNQAAKLHDIGKVIIPDSVLLKPGKLNYTEYDIIKLHLKVGYQMLSTIDFYKPIAEIMKYHHEKYDGTGYPYGKKGEEIPLLSRIMMVADAVDAMTSNRIYQKRKTLDEAVEEIKSLSGKWYHPEIVEALESIAQKDLIEVSETSQIPLTKMEHERFSYFFKDQMTGFYNEPYLWMILNKQIPQYEVTEFFMIDLHAMSSYNKIYGWHAGNILINNIAQILVKRFEGELIFRLFGDSFLVCFGNKEKFREKTKKWKELKLGNVYTSSKSITKLALIEELQSIW